jgi:general secretion pathway protein D
MPQLSRLLLLFLLTSSYASKAHADTRTSSADEEVDPVEEEVLNSCAHSKGKAQVSLRPGASLADLVSWAMSFSCKNFIYRSDIVSRSPKVEIVAPSELSPRQSWRLFQVAIQSLGLTIVKKGAMLHIVEAAHGSKAALPIRKRSLGDENMERLLVRPDYISVEDAQQALQALTSAQGAIVAMPSASALLVTDFGSHTGRMAELLREIDRPGPNEGLFAIHLRFANVEEVSKQLRQLLEADAVENAPRSKRKKGKAAPASRVPSLIVGDARTGTLLLRASEATYLRALRIVRKLDQRLAEDDSKRVHVYSLQHADATKLAATMSALTQSAAPPSKAPAGARKGAAQESGAIISDGVEISADVETNSLLIRSSLRDYLATKKLIARLDRQRPQVFLEVTILEVDLDNNLDYGGSFHLGKESKGKLLFGGSQHRGSRTVPLNALQSSTQQDGLVAGALGKLLPTEKFLGVSIPSFGVLFQAIAEDRRIDILSAPQLMTTNNTKAKLSVGQNVPYTAGSSTGLGGTQESIKRQDVDMTLEVTPHVNLQGMVRLEVDLSIKELLPNQEGLEPSWTTRKIENTVVVEDQESIAIGGLASEKESVTKSKIPLLGDVPVLGNFFRSTRKQKEKRNLLVLLTPYVLGDSDEARRFTQRKLIERDAFLRSYQALRSRKFDKKIDYRKKRGLLAEIDAVVRATEAEEAAMRELESQWKEPVDGPLLDAP